MLDYGEILDFLAKNPPQMDEEREVHASLLELMAQCLRSAKSGEHLACPAQLQDHTAQLISRRRAS